MSLDFPLPSYRRTTLIIAINFGIAYRSATLLFRSRIGPPILFFPAPRYGSQMTSWLFHFDSFVSTLIDGRSNALSCRPYHPPVATGPNIAIITVRVRSARTCNVRDEVTVWNVADSQPSA